MSVQITDEPKVKEKVETIDDVTTRRVIIPFGGCCRFYDAAGFQVGSTPQFVTPPDFSASTVSLEEWDYVSGFTGPVELKATYTQTGFVDQDHVQLDAHDHGLDFPQSQMYGGGGLFTATEYRISDKFLVAPFLRYPGSNAGPDRDSAGEGILSVLIWLSCVVDFSETNAVGRFLLVTFTTFDPVGSEWAADWDEGTDSGKLYGGLVVGDNILVRTWGRYTLDPPDGLGAIDGTLVGTNTYDVDPIPTAPATRRVVNVVGAFPE